MHDDPSLLPAKRGAWSSWNITTSGDERVISYDLVRIQAASAERPWLVTLGSEALLGAIAPERIARRLDYRHPVIDAASRATQDALPTLNGVARTWFCGSYFGDGFHEDALASAEAVADALVRRGAAA